LILLLEAAAVVAVVDRQADQLELAALEAQGAVVEEVEIHRMLPP
jgi:hypothetical protein